jgi:hypothetical protein
MVQAEDGVEDEFHRRLASNSRRESSTSSHTSGAHAAAGGAGGGSGAGGGGPPGSFWRTDTPNWQGPAFSSMQIKPNTTRGGGGGDAPVTVNERNVSGGLLGAALQLHSQTESSEPGSAVSSTVVLSEGKKIHIYLPAFACCLLACC